MRARAVACGVRTACACGGQATRSTNCARGCEAFGRFATRVTLGICWMFVGALVLCFRVGACGSNTGSGSCLERPVHQASLLARGCLWGCNERGVCMRRSYPPCCSSFACVPPATVALPHAMVVYCFPGWWKVAATPMLLIPSCTARTRGACRVGAWGSVGSIHGLFSSTLATRK